MFQLFLPILRPLRSLVFVAGLSALFVLAGAGCRSATPEGFASVTIHGRTEEQIAAVTTLVFRDAGYSGGGLGGSQIVFQKAGSQWTNLAYEGAVGTAYGASTLVRVKVDIVNVAAGSYRLQCQAYVVRDAGDSFFEEEQALSKVRNGPYKTLLNKVAEQLK